MPKLENVKRATANMKAIAKIPELKELVDRHGGVTQAARAMGATGGAIVNWATQKSKYGEKQKARVMAALSGEPPPAKELEPKSIPDQMTMKNGITVVVVKAAIFEKVHSIGEELGGEWLLKFSTGHHWIGALKLGGAQQRVFVKVATYDVERIAAP